MKNHQPDYKAAENFALDILANKLPKDLYYHNLTHTVDEVLPAMEEFAEMENISGDELKLLRIATFFHDIGFINLYDEHVQVGIEIARKELPGFGFKPDQVDAICGMISATHLPQKPTNLLEMVLADADLSILGKDNFWERNELLRGERIAYGRATTLEEWYCDQLAFLEQHRYFTQAARSLRLSGKQKNIEYLLQKKLAICS